MHENHVVGENVEFVVTMSQSCKIDPKESHSLEEEPYTSVEVLADYSTLEHVQAAPLPRIPHHYHQQHQTNAGSHGAAGEREPWHCRTRLACATGLETSALVPLTGNPKSAAALRSLLT
jgi:hypothetical protein